MRERRKRIILDLRSLKRENLMLNGRGRQVVCTGEERGLAGEERGLPGSYRRVEQGGVIDLQLLINRLFYTVYIFD